MISKLEDDIETKYLANLDNCKEKEKSAKASTFENRVQKFAQPEKYAQAIEEAENNVIEANSVLATKERELEKFVQRYNNERYHESLNNLTPADVYFGRGDAILTERKRIKKLTLLARRKEYQREILSQSFENQNKINSFKSARNSN